jgi:hypothetical protein
MPQMNRTMIHKIIKYIVIGMFTFIAIRYIPTHAILDTEIIMVALCVSIVYAILDKLLPSYTNAPAPN